MRVRNRGLHRVGLARSLPRLRIAESRRRSDPRRKELSGGCRVSQIDRAAVLEPDDYRVLIRRRG